MLRDLQEASIRCRLPDVRLTSYSADVPFKQQTNKANKLLAITCQSNIVFLLTVLFQIIFNMIRMFDLNFSWH